MLIRSHGLGNDYLVADPADLPFELSAERVRLLCDRHRGVGSDGLLLLGREPFPSVRIFNPDGSEAEKSGNGLRIFAKWLFDTRQVGQPRFVIHTVGGAAAVEIESTGGRARQVTVDMGRPSFREDVRELEVGNARVAVVALSIGNPHCVIVRPRLDVAELRAWGPVVEVHPAFPGRTNVQLARAVARDAVELLIWERGAGETQASGSSACAVVAACAHLGLVDRQVDVRASMPGGTLTVRVDRTNTLWLRGPVEEIAAITLSPELVARLRALP